MSQPDRAALLLGHHDLDRASRCRSQRCSPRECGCCSRNGAGHRPPSSVPLRDPSARHRGPTIVVLTDARSGHVDAVTAVRCDRQRHRPRVRDRDRGVVIARPRSARRALPVLESAVRVVLQIVLSGELANPADVVEHQTAHGRSREPPRWLFADGRNEERANAEADTDPGASACLSEPLLRTPLRWVLDVAPVAMLQEPPTSFDALFVATGAHERRALSASSYSLDMSSRAQGWRNTKWNTSNTRARQIMAVGSQKHRRRHREVRGDKRK